jgi:hypothetical protein
MLPILAALRDVRRSAPVELIGFDAGSARFVDATGAISITFDDVTRREFSGYNNQ